MFQIEGITSSGQLRASILGGRRTTNDYDGCVCALPKVVSPYPDPSDDDKKTNYRRCDTYCAHGELKLPDECRERTTEDRKPWEEDG